MDRKITKFYRSSLLKAAAVLMAAVCAGMFVNTTINNFICVDSFYLFEKDFKSSHMAQVTLLEGVELLQAAGNYQSDALKTLDEEGYEYYILRRDGQVQTNLSGIEGISFDEINGAFSGPLAWRYYTYASSSPDQPVRAKADTYSENQEEGAEEYPVYVDEDEDEEIAQMQAVRLSESLIQRQAEHWEIARRRVTNNIWILLAFACGVLGCFIYLACVCGRKREDEEIHLLLIDRMFVEITVCLAAFFIIGGAAGCFVMVYETFRENLAGFFNTLAPVTAILAVLAGGTLLLSVIRNMKNRSFLERSLIARLIRLMQKYGKRIFLWTIGLLKRIIKGIKSFLQHILLPLQQNITGRKLIVLYLLFAGLLMFGTMFSTLLTDMDDGVAVFGLCVCIGIICYGYFWITKGLKGFDSLINGIGRIKDGDLSYKIDGCENTVFQQAAEAVNSLGEGLEKSLQEQIKAERMKSELITNVSHDLKTPLTSIMNYAELLSKETLTPAEANDYVRIIQSKGKRLQNLTSDLFDISKVQSGNEEIRKEKIDLVLLTKQALAELDEAISNAKFVLIDKLPEEEIFIWADGRKMSRVFENLLMNCIKYTMPGTRVYLSLVKTDDGLAVWELKNISAYEMNFDPETISERFVRGDQSRSTEGNGLGLAIARSYTNACGGIMKLTVDGDLFKVVITFPVI